MKRIVTVIACMLVLAVLWLAFKPRPEVVVDHAMRSETIDRLVAKLNEHYVFPEKAGQMETVLRQRQQEGKYDGIRTGYRLVQQLTADLHGVARDKHLKVRFAPGVDLTADDAPPPATQAEWEQRSNFVERFVARNMAARAVKKVDRLDHNIGYLKLSTFPDAVCVAGTFGSAMDELAGTDGLIVDLRQNNGGDPLAVVLLVSYFVDGRTRLNDSWHRASGNTIQHWTYDQLAGKRYGGTKPVMILVGPRTESAGEDFAYTMQALGRATVVGGQTWGGAQPFNTHRIGEHFYVQVPDRRSISPITGANWEGTGVTPDIAATPDGALAVAMKQIQRRLQGNAPRVVAAP